ncbi:unnamed protein product, partial [Protopolystoma xenopodis]
TGNQGILVRRRYELSVDDKSILSATSSTSGSTRSQPLVNGSSGSYLPHSHFTRGIDPIGDSEPIAASPFTTSGALSGLRHFGQLRSTSSVRRHGSNLRNHSRNTFVTVNDSSSDAQTAPYLDFSPTQHRCQNPSHFSSSTLSSSITSYYTTSSQAAHQTVIVPTSQSAPNGANDGIANSECDQSPESLTDSERCRERKYEFAVEMLNKSEDEQVTLTVITYTKHFRLASFLVSDQMDRNFLNLFQMNPFSHSELQNHLLLQSGQQSPSFNQLHAKNYCQSPGTYSGANVFVSDENNIHKPLRFINKARLGRFPSSYLIGRNTYDKDAIEKWESKRTEQGDNERDDDTELNGRMTNIFQNIFVSIAPPLPVNAIPVTASSSTMPSKLRLLWSGISTTISEVAFRHIRPFASKCFHSNRPHHSVAFYDSPVCSAASVMLGFPAGRLHSPIVSATLASSLLMPRTGTFFLSASLSSSTLLC